MERLTIDEIIAHCKRRVDHAEQFYGKGRFESVDMSHRIDKEYWEHRQVAEYLEELKEYRKAEEQGLLKMLPCRVGDTVFLVQYGKMYERKVNGFSVTSNNQLVIHIPDFEMDNASFPEHTFGKFVFFDRKKAESALAEKGGVE